jgi:3-methyladenine DNA glycosylase/8-oxoguanine DNA glycosylase
MRRDIGVTAEAGLLVSKSIERKQHIQVLADFNFRSTAMSNGWCVLAPFQWDRETSTLRARYRLPGNRGTEVVLSQPGGRGTKLLAKVTAGLGARVGLSRSDWVAVESAVTRILRLTDDLAPFYARCHRAGEPYVHAERTGFGRLIRAASLFEDVAKVLATTNTTWAGTTAMVANLVSLADNQGVFPTPERVVAIGAKRLREQGRWGYRAEPLARIARAAATGRLDFDRWESWDGSTADLEAEILELPGIGPYAAAHVLAVLGRYDRIGLDTVFRGFVKEKYFPKARKPVTDKRMLEIYDVWGEWRALAYWFDLWYSPES